MPTEERARSLPSEAVPSPEGSGTIRIPRGPDDAAGAAQSQAYVTVIRGSEHDLGRYVVVERRVAIGRAVGADLRLQDRGVSRDHVRIERGEDDVYRVSDLGSTNGTHVGGELLGAARPLREGDKIFLGDTVLRFALADDIDLGYQTEVAQIVGQDPLTGLESKRRFDGAFDFAVESALLGAEPLALLMMDMDGVKRINDTHGHLFGAHVIGETGRIIARHLGSGGHACRFGGDEFCAFLPCDLAGSIKAAEAIRTGVEAAEMSKDGIALAPTLSIGVAALDAAGDDPVALLARADAALYRAKEAGRNRTAT